MKERKVWITTSWGTIYEDEYEEITQRLDQANKEIDPNDYEYGAADDDYTGALFGAMLKVSREMQAEKEKAL